MQTGSFGVETGKKTPPFTGGDGGPNKKKKKKNIEVNPLLGIYGNYIKKIDSSLKSELELYSESEFIEPLKYAMESGKRIRPLILILSAESIGKADDNAYVAS